MFSMLETITISPLLLITAFVVFQAFFRSKSIIKLPPGPKSLPVIGNILDLPPPGVPAFQHWLKHKDAYGSLSSITVLGYTLIILHDRQATLDLMVHSSQISSDRPQMDFAFDLCGIQELPAIMKYTPEYRARRKMIQKMIGTRAAVSSLYGVMEHESEVLLRAMQERPAAVLNHLRSSIGATILKATYGYNIEREGTDPLVDTIERLVGIISLALVPLSCMVDTLPFIKYLPKWFPGMGFKRIAQECKRLLHSAVESPYALAREQVVSGMPQPSFVCNLLQESFSSSTNAVKAADENRIKWTAALMYLTGVETTVGALHTFILAMIMFPSVQSKAQAELDQVVGRGRLPNFSDRGRLRYIEGLVKELLRWCPAGPLGIPHVMTEATCSNGYDIPKGAILIPNIWWFLHDPAAYHDPGRFDPERFLPPRMEADPGDAFGYGRRACPGRYFAESSMFITVARVLSRYTFSHARDSVGASKEVNLRIKPGIHAEIEHFPFKVVARYENEM